MVQLFLFQYSTFTCEEIFQLKWDESFQELWNRDSASKCLLEIENMRGEMERLSQKEMRNHKANTSSITVLCFGKTTWFSAYVSWSGSIGDGRSLLVSIAEVCDGRELRKRRGTCHILKGSTGSSRHRDHFVVLSREVETKLHTQVYSINFVITIWIVVNVPGIP